MATPPQYVVELKHSQTTCCNEIAEVYNYAIDSSSIFYIKKEHIPSNSCIMAVVILD